MIGQCLECNQIKNLVGKQLCKNCYSRLRARKVAITHRQERFTQDRKCFACGNLLNSNNNIGICSHCYRQKIVLEKQIESHLRTIQKIERKIKICEKYNSSYTMEEIGKEFGITKQRVFTILQKGLDYYKESLIKYKTEYIDIVKKVKLMSKSS